jgi:hypothetical protein
MLLSSHQFVKVWSSPIEAMHFAKPVFICKTSLPEVGGKHAYWDNLDPDI